MYKVFVNERPLVLSNKPLNLLDGPSIAFETPQQLLALYNAFKANPNMPGISVFADDVEALKQTFFSLFKVIEAAGGVVQNNDGHYLFIKRLGYWDLPKGKLDKGEGIEAAALREVEEECGINGLSITLPLGQTYHTYTHKGAEVLKITYWFAMQTTFSGELVPQTEEDITEASWMSKEDIKTTVLANTYASIVSLIAGI